MIDRRTFSSLKSAYYQGEITRGDLFDGWLSLVTPTTVDLLLDAVPSELWEGFTIHLDRFPKSGDPAVILCEGVSTPDDEALELLQVRIRKRSRAGGPAQSIVAVDVVPPGAPSSAPRVNVGTVHAPESGEGKDGQ